MTSGQILLMVAAHVLLPFIAVPAVAWLISALGGWGRLAEQFPARPKGEGKRGGMASIRLGRWCSYNNCVGWHADDEYLHLAVPFFLRPGHPPMSLPWVAVEIGELKGSLKTRNRFREVAVGGKRVWLPERMLERELENRRLLAEAGQPAAAGNP